MNYAEYLKTDYWKAVSARVKERAGYRCQICNSQHDLQAHHRTYERRGKELDFLADMTCLCRRCHAVFHGHLPPVPAPPPQVAKPAPAQPAVVINKEKLSKRERRENRLKTMPDMTNIRPHTKEEIDALMPDGDGPIVLTKFLIDRTRTLVGAFTTATLEALKTPDTMAGWPQRLIGKTLSRDEYRKAVEGRYVYASRKFAVAK